jgi:hypothetical protein
MRKTRGMLDLETKHGRPVERLMADALTQHGTIERAALSLGVNPATFYGWMMRLRVQTRKVAFVA